jgi:hypothetical protein
MDEKGGKDDLRREERDFFTWSTGWGPKGSKLQSAGGAMVGILYVVGTVLCGVTALEEVPDEVVDYQEQVPADRGHQDSKD